MYKNEEWLRNQYLSELKSANDIAIICGVGSRCIRKWMKKFGIQPRSPGEGCKIKWQDKSFKARMCKAIKIGCNKPSTLAKKSECSKNMWLDPEFKDKRRKIMQSEEYKQKQSASQKKRMLDPEQYNKARETLIKNSKDPEILKKINNSLKALWGDPEFKQHMLDKMRNGVTEESNIKKITSLKAFYNSPIAKAALSARSREQWLDESYRNKVISGNKKRWATAEHKLKMAKIREKLPPTSILEHITTAILLEFGIDSKQMAMGPWTFDVAFEYDDRKILIECQGTYWHSLQKTITKDKQKKTYFDRYLSHEFELYYIHEYEFYGAHAIRQKLTKILDIDNEIIDLKFSDVILKTIERELCNEFFSKHHYLSKGRAGLHIGATINNQLIAAITYTGVTRKQTAERLGVKSNEILELSRFCIHPQYQKKNFASWLLARSLKSIPQCVKILVAFSDIGMGHYGTIYKASNWETDGETKPSYWYVDQEGHRYHKKSVWDQAKRIGLKEQEYVDKCGLSRCNGLPVLRFIKRLR